jgi:hypothetical protein
MPHGFVTNYIAVVIHYGRQRASEDYHCRPQPMDNRLGFILSAPLIAGLVFPTGAPERESKPTSKRRPNPAPLLPFPRTRSRTVPDVENDHLVVHDLIHDQIFIDRKS